MIIDLREGSGTSKSSDIFSILSLIYVLVVVIVVVGGGGETAMPPFSLSVSVPWKLSEVDGRGCLHKLRAHARLCGCRRKREKQKLVSEKPDIKWQTDKS